MEYELYKIILICIIIVFSYQIIRTLITGKARLRLGFRVYKEYSFLTNPFSFILVFFYYIMGIVAFSWLFFLL